MSSNLTLITGLNIKYDRLSADELKNFNCIGDGENFIKKEEIEKSAASNVAVIHAHGFLLNRENENSPIKKKDHCILSLDKEFEQTDGILPFKTADNILLLQKMLHVAHFYLFSCFGGAVVKQLNEYRDQLLDGTTVTLFSSAKYPSILSYNELTIRKISEFYQKNHGKKVRDIDERFFIENLLHGPFTTTRCEIIKEGEEKKLLAFKTRSPKTKEEIKSLSKSTRVHNKLKIIFYGEMPRFQEWLQMANSEAYWSDPTDYRNLSLVEAALRGKLKRGRSWIKHGAEVNLNKSLASIDCSALHAACFFGHPKMAQLFIEKGSNVEHADDNGVTPLFVASQGGYTSIVEKLIAANANVNARKVGGHTPLASASQHGHEEIVTLLLKAGAEVDCRNEDNGGTPLIAACLEGHNKTVKLLMDARADIHHVTYTGEPPLYAACQNGHTEIVQMLIEARVHVDQANNEGFTPFYVACQKGNEEIFQVLIDAKASINHRSSQGYTPLYIASKKGYEGIVQKLIKLEAVIDATSQVGFTPLLVAALQGHTKVVQSLIEAKAEINHASVEGFTPLYVACQNGHTEIAQMLIEAGAEVDVKTKGGLTPYDIANRQGHQEIGALVKNEEAKKKRRLR